jgi:hypothetical protein
METTIVATYTGLRANQFHWHVVVTRGAQSFETTYSAGLAHCSSARRNTPGSIVLDGKWVKPTAPSVAGMLDCLRSDAHAGESNVFEDFASEFGYDSDSRKAEAIWHACQKIRGELQRLYGSEFDAFMNESESE